MANGDYLDNIDYTRILYIFCILFFISNITNGFVTVLLCVSLVLIILATVFKREDPYLPLIAYSNIVSLFFAHILSWIMLAANKGPQGYTIKTKLLAMKRPAFFGYFIMLFILCISPMIDDNYLQIFFSENKKKQNITVLIFIASLSLLCFIKRINLLVNTYECDEIKENDLVQSFQCEKIKINNINE
tara:strand:- start:140 stop:703 length:564 start_codon:yes stop_codon:yes gene_type:complete